MMFWKKKKKVVIDAFTDNDIVATHPIEESSKNLPNWYKKLKPTLEVNGEGHTLKIPTFKRCDGVSDLIRNSFTISMWADLSLAVDSDGRYNWKYPSNQYNFGVDQHPEFLMDSAFSPMVHTKVMSPWLLRETKGINFYQTQAFYSFNEFGGDILIPPGVVNYKYQQATHINMFVSRNKTYMLKAGQPMMYLVPMTEDKVEVKTHVISTAEYKRILNMSAGNKFLGSYKNLKSKGLCPMTRIS
jgi:hypothetical protein